MKLLTKNWVDKAEGDWKVALQQWKSPEPVYDAICFHCQQCMEKYLKAILVEEGKEVPKTHDLAVLVERLKKHKELVVEKNNFANVGGYAVEIRYPNGEVVLRQDAKEAVELTIRVRKKFRKALGLGKNS